MSKISEFEKFERALIENILDAQTRIGESEVCIQRLKIECDQTLLLFGKLEKYLSNLSNEAFHKHAKQWHSLNNRLVVLYSLIGSEHLTGDAK